MRFLPILLLIGSPLLGGDMITRATANLNGVTSARGFFNITVRLYQLTGVEWAKYDLKKSQITLDFEPGATVTPEALRNVMSAAGYKPGNIEIHKFEKPDRYEHRLGWNKIHRPTSKNAAGRWFQLNF
jgi:copper chaperone CopZ